MIDLQFIAQQAIDKEEENFAFRSFLKNKKTEDVDEKMLPIGKYFTQNIDCTQCGNCCKNIMISVDDAEIKRIAIALKQDVETCKNKYFEYSTDSSAALINAIPCHFLKEKKCTIYENRPSACASFPHVHLPHFTSRLFSMIDAYGICPIVYHSMEALKIELKFLSE